MYVFCGFLYVSQLSIVSVTEFSDTGRLKFVSIAENENTNKHSTDMAMSGPTYRIHICVEMFAQLNHLLRRAPVIHMRYEEIHVVSPYRIL